MRYLLAIAASALLVPFGIAQQTPTTTSPSGNMNTTQNGTAPQSGQSTTASPSINANQSARPGSASPSSNMEHPAPLPESQIGQSGAVGSSTQQSGSTDTTGTATTTPQSGSSMSNTTGVQPNQATPGAAASQQQSNTGATASQSASTQNSAQANSAQNQQVLQGCIVQRDTAYFLQPANGGPEVRLNANRMQPYNRVMNNEEAQVFGHYGNSSEAAAASIQQNSAKHESTNPAATGSMSASNPEQQAGVSEAATQSGVQTATTSNQAGSATAVGSQSTATGSQNAATGTTTETGTAGQQGQEFQVTRVVSISAQCTPAGANPGANPR